MVHWLEFKASFPGNNIATPELSDCEELETGACLSELEDGTIAYF